MGAFDAYGVKAGHRETVVPSTTVTASGDSGVWAGDYGMAKAIRVQVRCTAASGTTPSMVVTIEDSVDDGATWNVIDTFGAITAATRIVRTTSSTFGPKLRASWAITGTTPSFTFAIDVYGKQY
jgi:hypothetical protein